MTNRTVSADHVARHANGVHTDCDRAACQWWVGYGRLTPPVPGHLRDIGPVLAAIPTHVPTHPGDPAEWVVLCRRDDVADRRAFCTNRVQRLGDDVLATGGNYELTYAEALADLYDRAGVTDKTGRVRRAWAPA